MAEAKKKELESSSDDLLLSALERIENLELMISNLCALTGNRNMATEYNLKPWDPSPKHMSKFRK